MLQMHDKDFTLHFNDYDKVAPEMKVFLKDFFKDWNFKVAPILAEIKKDK